MSSEDASHPTLQVQRSQSVRCDLRPTRLVSGVAHLRGFHTTLREKVLIGACVYSCADTRYRSEMADPPNWTRAHQDIVDRGVQLEDARRRVTQLRGALVRLHEVDGVERIEKTRLDFNGEKRAPASEGRPVDPLFDSWVAFERAVEQLQVARRALYTPEFLAALESLRLGDVAAAEWATVFLEADPRCFRAGYVSERILRYLARMASNLPAAVKTRLANVILAAVDDTWRPEPWGPNPWRPDSTPQRREFKWFCRLARKLDAPELTRQLAERLHSRDPAVAERARLALGPTVAA
jgi:hypothetical protein